MNEPTTPDLTDLRDDGDSIDLPDGRKLTLRIEVDMDSTVNDFDCYGKVEWGTTHRDTGRNVRPEGFDGAARILNMERGDALWWQPPSKEMIGCTWDADTLRKEAFRVSELCEYGFKNVGLELSEVVTDSIGNEHRVVLDDEWLCGVDLTGGDIAADLEGLLPDIYDNLLDCLRAA